MRLNTTARIGAATLALALTAAGCSSDRSGEDGALSGGGGGSTAATSFGDLESPCGDGEASGATDQGVTDTTITIGYGDDRGFAAAPGLSQEAGDAVKAMIAWCNEQGGINGRKIVGNQYDAALTNAPAVVQESCAKDFMLVGQGFAYDEAAEQFRVACELPTVPAFTIGPNAGMGPMKFEPIPYPADRYNSAGLALLIENFPEFEAGPTPIYSDSPPVQSATAKVLSVLDKLGVKAKDCGITLSSQGEANYVPFAEKFKSCGADALWTSNGPIPSQFGMIEALGRVGKKVQLVGESQWYGEVSAGYNAKSGLLDGMVTPLQIQPFENAGSVPAVQQYLDIMEKSGGKTALLGMQATSAFLLWASAAKECGAELTRDCVLEQLADTHEWTGGGLHAPTDPGANLPPSCALLAQLTGSEWKQVAPETPGEFSCDEEHVVELDPKLSGVTLNDDRISVAFLKQ